KKLAIENDLQYQTDQMTYDGAKKRTLLTAEDNTRFELNLNGSLSTGSTGGDSENSGLKSLVNGINQTSLISLNLVVPIDDRAAKIAVQNAKIALQEARLAMQQEKWNKETNAINQWNNIFSAKRSLHYAENAEHLQRKTYEISDQKYSHGLIDSLQLQSSQQQLMASEQALNMAQINYLKALVNFDLLVGQTLKTWKVKTKNC
ncbi:MAG TPA: TolC family protein, partial [Gammaproteobacteria bacterium]|nr:TolC family protein [Gammaproteobacteria bacterium]